jgi:hypothetical protein
MRFGETALSADCAFACGPKHSLKSQRNRFSPAGQCCYPPLEVKKATLTCSETDKTAWPFVQFDKVCEKILKG